MSVIALRILLAKWDKIVFLWLPPDVRRMQSVLRQESLLAPARVACCELLISGALCVTVYWTWPLYDWLGT